MFLNQIIRRNRGLVETAVLLHQQGQIPSDCYLLDIDTIAQNARVMAVEGEKNGLKVLAMTKQIGRNPVAIQAICEAGIEAGVCVDMRDAGAMAHAGMKIGHLGHLVQVPFAETRAGLELHPWFWTVYSEEKAKEIADALLPGEQQNVMTRIYGEGDSFYHGHEAGFPAETILETAEKLNTMGGLRFLGITTFPAQLYRMETGRVETTNNYETLLRTAEMLRSHGFSELEVNAPGTTSSHLFAHLASDGVTQVEPGHGLTGTTPIHAFRELAERPAYVYVSEVSHFFGGKPYCFGGGMYIDPVFPPYEVKACVGPDPETALGQQITCEMPAAEAIDYYGILEPQAGQSVRTGDTVVFGFRAQMFVTRSYVAAVTGISKGQPKVEGIFTTDGRETGWPKW